MAQLVNVIAPIFTNESGLFLQTIFHPLQLIANHCKGKSLSLFVDSPSYDSKRYGPTPYLDSAASLDGNTLALSLVNRHKDQPIDVEFELQDRTFAGPLEVSEVNGPDIKAENDFGKTTVKTVTRSITADGKKLRVSLPAHSYALVKGALR
jgi:alpha-N-arabinofuranosidase